MPMQRSVQNSNGHMRINFSRSQQSQQQPSSMRNVQLNSNGQPKVSFTRPSEPNRTMQSQTKLHNALGFINNQTKQNLANGNAGAIRKTQTVHQRPKVVTKSEPPVNLEQFPKTAKSMEHVAQELLDLIGNRCNGVYSTQLEVESKRKFKEELPDQW